MSEFKIIFPSGYAIQNITNDNIDVNVILSNGSVYFATVFTILNIQSLMTNEEALYFWSMDMIVIKDLAKETIRNAVAKIIEDGYLEYSFSKIGTIDSVYPGKELFKDILNDA